MMIKVVLDANQYVSVLLKPGSKPDQVFQLAQQKEINLLLSPKILSELRRVLLYPKLTKIHQRTSQQIDNLLEKIARIAEITPAFFGLGSRFHVAVRQAAGSLPKTFPSTQYLLGRQGFVLHTVTRLHRP